MIQKFFFMAVKSSKYTANRIKKKKDWKFSSTWKIGLFYLLLLYDIFGRWYS